MFLRLNFAPPVSGFAEKHIIFVVVRQNETIPFQYINTWLFKYKCNNFINLKSLNSYEPLSYFTASFGFNNSNQRNPPPFNWEHDYEQILDLLSKKVTLQQHFRQKASRHSIFPCLLLKMKNRIKVNPIFIFRNFFDSYTVHLVPVFLPAVTLSPFSPTG